MKIFSQCTLSALLLVTSSQAFSLNDLKSHKKPGLAVGEMPMLTQKEVTRMATRRDTIQMPSQTPMVPWRVSTLYGWMSKSLVQCNSGWCLSLTKTYILL